MDKLPAIRAGKISGALTLIKKIVTKSPEKKGTTKDTKSTKKSFSFPL